MSGDSDEQEQREDIIERVAEAMQALGKVEMDMDMDTYDLLMQLGTDIKDATAKSKLPIYENIDQAYMAADSFCAIVSWIEYTPAYEKEKELDIEILTPATVKAMIARYFTRDANSAPTAIKEVDDEDFEAFLVLVIRDTFVQKCREFVAANPIHQNLAEINTFLRRIPAITAMPINWQLDTFEHDFPELNELMAIPAISQQQIREALELQGQLNDLYIRYRDYKNAQKQTENSEEFKQIFREVEKICAKPPKPKGDKLNKRLVESLLQRLRNAADIRRNIELYTASLERFTTENPVTAGSMAKPAVHSSGGVGWGGKERLSPPDLKQVQPFSGEVQKTYNTGVPTKLNQEEHRRLTDIFEVKDLLDDDSISSSSQDFAPSSPPPASASKPALKSKNDRKYSPREGERVARHTISAQPPPPLMRQYESPDQGDPPVPPPAPSPGKSKKGYF